jgi:hypothetical protein
LKAFNVTPTARKHYAPAVVARLALADIVVAVDI